MVITIPDKILGVKMASSSDDERPRLNLVVDKFSPTLGVNLKVWSISDADLYSATKKKNQEYDHESPPRRVIYDEICCGLNPRKSVLSRSSHIENTKKVSVGRLMRSGCKVHYLRRRQKILAAYNKRRLAPPPSVLNNCFPHEDVLSNSATTQTITALSVFPFKVIESPRRSINGWKLSPANLSPLMKKDHHCKEIAIEKSCIEAKTKKSEGLNQELTSSSLASCIEEVAKRVELLKHELAICYTSKHCLKWADLLFSWIPKTGALPPYEQVFGECWAAALQRGRAYYMAANDIKGKELTIKELLNGVARMSSGGLDRLESAKDFMVANGYVKDMIVHRRPSHPTEYAGYEILLEKLLARGPVVVAFDVLPGYKNYDGKGIYTPEKTTCQVAWLEIFKQHSVVVTGCGVGLVEENPIEFWQTHDSQYPEWGVNGFGQLARRKGLIVAAVEFEF